jgi:perosamine synthetase
VTNKITMPRLPSDQDASGRTLGDEEIAAITEVLRSGTLTSTKGNAVHAFERAFAQRLGVGYAIACASGSAAVHAAIAAIDPEPGDEIVTTPITDMGAIAPILYQAAIPVFADVDPRTWNVTAKTVAAAISSRTKAIIVTHLFGNPAAIEEIIALGDTHGIPVIEDCAQAFFARSGGRFVGTIGRLGAFSLQQGKHITCGEGGIVVTDDKEIARRVFLFVNKAWGYGDPKPDHYFLAPNYRLSELQGAVAGAQFKKLDRIVLRRRELADRFTKLLVGIPGISIPHIEPGAEHVYWKYALRVDDRVIAGGPVALGAQLSGLGIASAPRYIQKPAFDCAVIREKRTFGTSGFPFTLARPETLDYTPSRFPGTYEGLASVLVLPWNEKYEEEHIAYLASSIRDAVTHLINGGLTS